MGGPLQNSIVSRSLGIVLVSNLIAWAIILLGLSAGFEHFVLDPVLTIVMRGRLLDVREAISEAAQVGNWPYIRSMTAALNASPSTVGRVHVVLPEDRLLLPEELGTDGACFPTAYFLQLTGGVGGGLGQVVSPPPEAFQSDRPCFHAGMIHYVEPLVLPGDVSTDPKPLIVVSLERSSIRRSLVTGAAVLLLVALAGTTLAGVVQFLWARRAISRPVEQLASDLAASNRTSGIRVPSQGGYDLRELSWIAASARSFVDQVRVEQEARTRLEQENRNLATEAAIARMVQMLAHDVRKPFSLLALIIRVVKEAQGSGEALDLLDESLPEVEQALASVSGMIEDVMEVGSNRPLHVESHSCATILLGALGGVVRLRDACDLHFSWRLEHRHLVQVDAQKVSRVFSNIIDNAFSAAPRGERMWFHTRDLMVDGRPFVECRIGNSGSHIAPSELERIFDSFYTKGKRGGTGLGLAIARKVTIAHGGRIACTSSSNEVEFQITLPAGPGTDLAPAPHLPDGCAALRRERSWQTTGAGKALERERERRLEARVREAVRSRGRPMRLLVVDDEAIYCRMLSAYFHESGSETCIEIEHASSPHDAALIAGRLAGYDLILIDIDLADDMMNGFDVLKQVRAATSSALVCMHSSRLLISDHRRTVESGADAFFPKPLSKENLLALLQQSAQMREQYSLTALS